MKKADQVEVLDATDTVGTIRVDCRATLGNGEGVVSGDLSATRCP